MFIHGSCLLNFSICVPVGIRYFLSVERKSIFVVTSQKTLMSDFENVIGKHMVMFFLRHNDGASRTAIGILKLF